MIDWGEDDTAQWMVTAALPGGHAVGDVWRARRSEAIVSMSVDWNFGEGHHQEFDDAYGIAPDHERIRYYRELWTLES